MWQKNGVFPVWAVALVVAAAAPLLVRFIANEVERRVRERTAPVAAEIARKVRKRGDAVSQATENKEA